MIRYYYNENTGAITRKSQGTAHFLEPLPYVETKDDYDITQWKIIDGEFFYNPMPKATNPRG
jgi:hypothetical protein